MPEPRKWTLERNGLTITEVDCELPQGERVEVVEAAPVEAELADLKAKNAELFDKLIAAELQSAVDRSLGEKLHAECERLRTVLENIRFAYDAGLNEIPDVDAAIEAQVRAALEGQS